MDNRKPIYPYTLQDAVSRDEKDRWRENDDLNRECVQAIKSALAENHDGMRLARGAADAAIREYGIDRVKYVLANTIQHFDYDGRITGDNKAWAKQFIMPGNEHERRGHIVDSSGLVDILTREVRKIETQLIQVADQIIEFGRSNTTSGNYFVNYEEAGAGIMPPEKVAFFKEEIAGLLNCSEALIDPVYITDDGEFDLTFGLSYTPNYEPWQEEIDEHGEDWPIQEDLTPLAAAGLDKRLFSIPAETRTNRDMPDKNHRPSVLGQLRENQNEIKSTPSTPDTAHSKSNDLEV